MNSRFPVAAAAAVLSISGAAQAAVVGPHSGVRRAAEILDSILTIHRTCRTRLKCNWFPCRLQQTCFVTKDYPPQHGSVASATRAGIAIQK